MIMMKTRGLEEKDCNGKRKKQVKYFDIATKKKFYILVDKDYTVIYTCENICIKVAAFGSTIIYF
jgi:hypothetical protein